MLGGGGEAYSAGSRPDWVGDVQPPWNGLSDAPAIAMRARVFESVSGVTQATSVASLIPRTVGNRGIAPKPTQSGMLQITHSGVESMRSTEGSGGVPSTKMYAMRG